MRSPEYTASRIDKHHKGVCSAYPRAVFCAVKVGSPYTGILFDNLDAASSETLFDPFTVTQLGLNRAGAERSRENDGWNRIVMHS